MFPRLLIYFDAGTLLLAAIGLVRLRPIVRQTSLTTVLPWAWVAWSSALVGWGLRLGGHVALVSYVDYFTAVAVLSPPLASLGARRPMCRSWPFFVLLPMFAVLCWPAISVGLATRFARSLELETPAIVMYGVVLIMAMGNYALGRLRALVILLGWLLMGLVCGESTYILSFPTEFQRSLASVIAVASIYGFRQSADHSIAIMTDEPFVPKPTLDRFDRTLLEFGELYGHVWWSRMEDRLNVFAKQYGWPGQFFVGRGLWTEPLTEAQQAEVERAFRWLFRRFVDPEWLDARLTFNGTAVAKEGFTSPIDS